MTSNAIMLGMLRGHVVTRLLAVAAELNLADALAGGPLPVAELAARTGSHTPSLARLLRALAGMGVFAAVLPEGGTPHPGRLVDILMLALHPGRERTEAEFAALFTAAGLRHTATAVADQMTGVLVAVPELSTVQASPRKSPRGSA